MADYVMTSQRFVETLRRVNESLTQYATGAFGAVAGLYNNRERYAKNSSERTAKKIMECPDGSFLFDCINLGKSILWQFSFDEQARYGGAQYASNGVPDFGVKSVHKYCTTWIEDGCKDPDAIQPGEWLRTKDKTHIAFYAGDGKIIESTQKGKCRVREADLTSRTWEGHGKIQYLDYEASNRIKGDVNGDGIINMTDVLMVKRIVNGTYKPTPEELWAADVNGDGKVNMQDYLRLKRKVINND